MDTRQTNTNPSELVVTGINNLFMCKYLFYYYNRPT